MMFQLLLNRIEREEERISKRNEEMEERERDREKSKKSENYAAPILRGRPT